MQEQSVTPEPIMRIATGFMASKHLFVANELGLFEQLGGGPQTLAELAAGLGLPPRTARITADAMLALGLLEKCDGRYQNSAVAQRFLSGKTPADLRPFLRFWDQISYPHWHRLAEAVRTNRGMMPELDARREQIFSSGVAAFTTGPARALAAKYDFSGHHKIADLGGGMGTFLLAILARYPQLATTLFELPPVAALAKESLTNHPHGERIRVLPGDLFIDPIPAGCDALILANVVHYFDEERNLALLQRIRAGATPGTGLLLADFWMNPEHTQPLFAALMAGEFLALMGGDVFSEAEVHGWLRDTGWQPGATIPLEGPLSLIVAEAV
jgi:hypothetical protein